MDGRFQKFLRLAFGNKPKVLPMWEDETPKEPLIRFRSPNPYELVLGWASNTDKVENRDVHQLKGISQKYRDAHFYIVGACLLYTSPSPRD
jgi:hypothetical protein